MAYTIVYHVVKVYKVVNNVETFKYHLKLFLPFDNTWDYKTATSYNFPTKALNEVGLPSIITYTNIAEKPSDWGSMFSSPDWLIRQFGHVINCDEFENSIMRLVFDEHRRIDITMRTFAVSQTNVSSDNRYVAYYYDNRLIYGISMAHLYNTISRSTVNARTETVGRSIAFPSPDGTRLCYINLTAHQSCDIAEGQIVGEVKDYTVTTNSLNADLTRWLQGFEPTEYDMGNPYIDGGISDKGGGGGNFSEDSDTPETDDMPEIGAVGTGFATIFKPSISQLKDLSALFWNSNVFKLLQNLVENITNMFTSLAMVPFNVDAGRTVSVTWLGIDTAISLTLAAKQYYEFDMGSINMADDSRIYTSGSVLDYSPFSKLGIYLPFIGYQDLDIDECRGAVINLRYRIDILSGACVAILKVGGRDLYQFTGNCLTQIPITNESMQSLVSDAVNVGIAAAGVGAASASAGAGLAEAAGSKQGIQPGDIAHAHATVNRAESGLASATVNAVIGSKPTFNKSGAISSSASMMALRQPFLFLSTPRQSIPDHYQRYRGFPSNITSKLGDLSGFTVVEDIRLNGLVATSPEVAEIYDLLKKGVII